MVAALFLVTFWLLVFGFVVAARFLDVWSCGCGGCLILGCLVLWWLLNFCLIIGIGGCLNL
jgi:hypothetical protein